MNGTRKDLVAVLDNMNDGWSAPHAPAKIGAEMQLIQYTKKRDEKSSQ